MKILVLLAALAALLAGLSLLEQEKSPRYVEIYVSETDAGRYAPGAEVSLHAPAIGRDFSETVRFCEAAPEFAELRMVRERGQADLTLFRVRIDVPADVEGLLTGMTVEVQNE